MPVKIRLARHGKKGKPFYHVVIANSRSPRDGRYIERIGTYNPNTNPATVNLNFERALKWLRDGAQPSDTCRKLLADNGVLIKNHLLKGVDKGAFTAEAAEEKFQKWVAEKEAKKQSQIDKLNMLTDKEAKKKFEAEIKANEEKAKAVLAKQQAQRKAEQAAAAEETVVEADTETTNE
jgi:small subunit ribosomal protein S16